jgi:acylphosphatase
MSETVARAVVARGRVQGVFFRDSCRQEADARGVTGWVSNAADGTVHAYFEGPPDAVQQMVDWLHEGPRHASVDHVVAHEVPPEGLTTFDIR